MTNYDLTLLYVEDNLDEKRALLKKITPMFKKVYQASNGNEAYELFQGKKPDIILTDYQMPECDGLELIKKVRQVDSNIHIIMITGYTIPDNFMEAIEYKINSYLSKPLKIIDLLAILEKNAKEIINEKQNSNLLNLLEEYKKTVDVSSIVSTSDLKGNIKYVNKPFEDISGFKKEELIGKPHSIIRHPDTPSSVFEDLWHTIKVKKEPWFGVLKNRKKDGTSYYVDSVINPILDLNGNILEFIAIRKDITEIMNPKKQLINALKINEEPTLILVKIFNYDILKEFYNERTRRKFEKYFSSHFLSLCRPYFDTKKIYILNDGLFGFIENNNYPQEELILKIKEILKKSKLENIEFEDNKYDLDLLFSFAFKNDHQFEDALIGIEKMDNKNEIINSTNLYNLAKKEAQEKINTLKMIKNALKQDDKIVSFYQPIVCNKNKEIVKYESLIRLITDDEEVLSPFYFMEVAKKTGYYEELTYKVILNASKILELDNNIKISINLSASDIEDSQIRSLLLNLISNEANKSRITFELLEDEDTKDLSLISEFISLAKQKGDVKISIDDFGSGYSNFERLSQFQPDFIKIDGSLVKDISTNKYNESVLKALVVFAKENNIKTIAEFVSNEEIYEKVTKLGIDYSQGYFFGKPEPIIL